MFKTRSLVLLALVVAYFGNGAPLRAQSKVDKQRDATKRGERTMGHPGYGLQSVRGNAIFTIKNVDITHFPEMGVIFSAVDNRNNFIRTLKKEDVVVKENGIQRPIVSLDLVSGANRVPIDIV